MNRLQITDSIAVDLERAGFNSTIELNGKKIGFIIDISLKMSRGVEPNKLIIEKYKNKDGHAIHKDGMPIIITEEYYILDGSININGCKIKGN